MRERLLAALLVAIAATVLIYLGLRLNSAKVAAVQAADDLRICEQLANQIAEVSATPKKALEEQRSIDDLSSRIEQAAKASELAAGTVARILPQADRRIADTAYVAQPTRVECRNIGLKDLVFFIGELLSSDKAFHATTIRLSLPQVASSTESEAWNAELVLTHVLYSPTSTK